MPVSRKILRCSGRLLALVLLTACGSALADSFKLGGDCIVFDYDTNFPAGTHIVSTYHWSGSCDGDGFASGQGELKSFWNERLDESSQGTMVGGRLEGRAVTTSPDGGRFEGEYRRGHRTGRGVYTQSRDGALVVRYEGDFVDGLAEGHGVESAGNGGRHEGIFFRGARVGQTLTQTP